MGVGIAERWKHSTPSRVDNLFRAVGGREPVHCSPFGKLISVNAEPSVFKDADVFHGIATQSRCGLRGDADKLSYV